MISSQEQADALLSRSRVSLHSRSSLRSRSSWGTERTSDAYSRPTISRHTYQSQRESLLTIDGNEVVYQKYKWSKDPSLRARLLDIPKSFAHFLKNLSRAFGWRFVTMVICVYGLQQGLGNAWFFQARDYYLKDVLDLSPAQAQAYHSATYTPWSIKPMYGIVSDSVYLYGLQRAPYIAIAAGIGVISFAALAAFVLPLVAAAVSLFGGNISVSSPDVMIDAIVAQQCKHFPRFASDLQSLCWGAYSAFSIIGFGTSGIIIQLAGPRITFAAIILTALAVLIPAMLGYVGERRLKRQLKASNDVRDEPITTQHQRNQILSKKNLDENNAMLNPIRESDVTSEAMLSVASTVVVAAPHMQSTIISTNDESNAESIGRKTSLESRPQHNLMTDEEREKAFLSIDATLFNAHRSIFWLGLWVSFWAIGLAVVVLFIDIWFVRFIALSAIALTVGLSVFFVTRKKHPMLACVALFIFMRQVFTPDIEMSIFYWYTEADDGPHFSPIYIGFLKMVGYTMMFVGVVIYSRYLTHWQYKRIYITMQIVSAIVSLFDIIIVSRLNRKVGIPDQAMILSDTTLAPGVLRLIMMPTYVLSSKVCPSGTEATLFAMLMALSNFGNAISKYVGTALVLLFGVSNSNFDNFIWVVVTKSMMMLTPILFIPFLIPDGCPQDDDDEDEDDGTTYGSIRQSIFRRRSRRSHRSSAGSVRGISDEQLSCTESPSDKVTEATVETNSMVQ